MNARLLLSLAVLVPFAAYTGVVAIEHGPLGFLEPSFLTGWGPQALVDLMIALGSFAVLAVPDAKRRGLVYWPWLVASVLLGSIGVLGYFVYRELASRSVRVAQPA